MVRSAGDSRYPYFDSRIRLDKSRVLSIQIIFSWVLSRDRLYLSSLSLDLLVSCLDSWTMVFVFDAVCSDACVLLHYPDFTDISFPFSSPIQMNVC